MTDPGVFVKSLRSFRNRELSDLIIIDNYMYSYALDPSQGVLIKGFFDDAEDRELLWLASKLRLLTAEDDVVGFIELQFGLNPFYNYLKHHTSN